MLNLLFVSCAGTLAYAQACQFDDSTVRPIFGYINFCPFMVNQDPKELEDQIRVAMHEIIHVLGFSSFLFPYFYDPLTGYQQKETNVVKDVVVRGNEQVKMIVTPSVVNVVKQQFGCASAQGAELEKGGGDGTAGSHWEKLIFGPELMTGQKTTDGVVISALSFAFLQDMNYYKVAPNADFEWLQYGSKEGCGFLNSKCVVNGISANKPYFCTEFDTDMCTYSRKGYGPCPMYVYTTALPSEYAYFNTKTWGGDEITNFCPVTMPYTNRICGDQTHQYVSATGM